MRAKKAKRLKREAKATCQWTKLRLVDHPPKCKTIWAGIRGFQEVSYIPESTLVWAGWRRIYRDSKKLG